MSDQELELKQQSPKIYTNSIEFNQPTNDDQKLGAFFKLFLINNKISLPTHPELIEWGTTNPKTLHEDVDTFIGTYLTKKDKDGNHPSLREAGIFEHNYSNKADYVKTAIDFFKNHSVAKIVDVYKPDLNMLEASAKDPNMMLKYEAMAYTENPEMLQMIEDAKKKNEDIYVSPGVFALDSKTEGNKVIVNRFIGIHSSIVDHPAHTKPIAFIKKEICNNDHKTCYFKLLTASEMLNLNNNNSKNDNMATITQPSMGENNAPIPEVVNTKTEVKDAKGNVIETINNNPQNDAQKAKEQVTKEKDQGIEQVKKEVEDGKKEVEDSSKDKKTAAEDKDKEKEKDVSKMSKGELLDMMNNWKQDTIKEIEQRTEQKYRQARRYDILNTFIPSNNENLKEEHSFYKTLPITPEQLQKILENSKYNPDIQKALESSKSIKAFAKPNGNNDKPDTNSYTAGAARSGAITSDKVRTTTYNDANTGYGNGVNSLRHLTSGKKIPKKFA